MSTVTVSNKSKVATWECVTKSVPAPSISPGGSTAPIDRSDLADPNSLPIKLIGCGATGKYIYSIGTAKPIPFTLSSGQYTIPLPPGDSLSQAGPINVSIGDGQGGF